MAPTVILIRHAQALHNLTKDYQIRDPPLTDEGLEQCKPLYDSLRARFSHIAPEDAAIVASPMDRTLNTAQRGLAWLIEKGVKVVADPDWQENSSKPCDTGSPVGEVSRSYPAVDFSSVDPVWPDKRSPEAKAYHHTRDAILARGQRCIAALAARPEKFIFVVSHSGFLRVGVAGWWWFNADYRIFDFETDSAGVPKLKQHSDTIAGGLGLSWTEPVELGLDLPVEDTPEEDPNAAVV